jgi:predicted signal transduction protein with EAL and GGDEF domain
MSMTSSQTYLLGFIILILGLAAAAYLMNVPPVWIAVGVVVLIGIGIMAAASYSGTDQP